MSANNYVTPLFFPHPPPNFASSGSWNWTAAGLSQYSGEAQNSGIVALPPPPPPPYPPPNQTASNNRVAGTVSNINKINSDQNTRQIYYYSNTTSVYSPRRYNNSSTGQYNGSTQYSSPVGHYNTSPRQYNSALPAPYVNSNLPGYNRNYYGKRKSETDLDGMKKSNKKKKKPLSHNIPQRKDWSVDDAKKALMVEKDYNKRSKSQSLIIKFPDLELNREIVSKLNSSIESVHFQQPSTPRFCFVTLKDSAEPDVVIQQLNKTPFGQGHLCAEYKRDREDEINIGPEDIDPLTLYVGNLAQEVTKEDMVNTYPKQKRIDIGYAKKMKYTRYAFVSFKSVEDSIEAFQRTHATQMYSKSLIVRFRRLNGTVGMPGEPKSQTSHRNDTNEPTNNESHTHTINEHDASNHTSDTETPVRHEPWNQVDVTSWETHLKSVKEEPPEDSDEDDFEELDKKPPVPEYVTPFMSGCLDVAFSLHKPKVKAEVKQEENQSYSTNCSQKRNANIPQSNSIDRHITSDNVDNDCLIINSDRIKEEPTMNDFNNTFKSLRMLNKNNKHPSFTPIKVKKEISTPTMDESSNDWEERVSVGDMENSVEVKHEPNHDGDETNDGDDDESDDDCNFSSMLSMIKARNDKKLKKSFP